jgi:hypothetical protein
MLHISVRNEQMTFNVLKYKLFSLLQLLIRNAILYPGTLQRILI